jgi:hypothetical protein
MFCLSGKTYFPHIASRFRGRLSISMFCLSGKTYFPHIASRFRGRLSISILCVKQNREARLHGPLFA